MGTVVMKRGRNWVMHCLMWLNELCADLKNSIGSTEGLRRLRSLRREASGSRTIRSKSAVTYRLLAFGAEPTDCRQVQEFCRELGWSVDILRPPVHWPSVTWEERDAVVVMIARPRDPFIAELKEQRGEKRKGEQKVPFICFVPQNTDLTDFAAAGTMFEHVECKPVFLSTFKLIVTRACRGAYSTWPALPEAIVEDDEHRDPEPLR